MTIRPNTFAAAYAAGLVSLDDIDDWIDAWHADETAGGQLHDFLGLDEKGYTRWVSEPAALGEILASLGVAAPSMQHGNLTITHGVDSGQQQGSFMNATLSGISGDRAVSIAIQPPEGFAIDDPTGFNIMIATIFRRALDTGWKIEIQAGLDTDQVDMADFIANAASASERG